MNDKIKEILWKHTGTVNSFIDDNGHNRFDDCVKELSTCIEEHYDKLEEWAKENAKDAEVETGLGWYGEKMVSLDDLLSFIDKNK